jgi:hypothetical protein
MFRSVQDRHECEAACFGPYRTIMNGRLHVSVRTGP